MKNDKGGRPRESNTELAKYFDKYDITDTYMSAEIGVSRASLREYVKDPLKMKLIHLEKMSEVLGVEIDWLLQICLGLKSIDDDLYL